MMRFLSLFWVVAMFCLSAFPVQGQAGAQRLPGDLIVQLESHAQLEDLLASNRQFQDLPTGLQVIRPLSPPFHIWLLHFEPSGFSENAFLDHIRRQPGVVLAQFNHRVQLRNLLPDDPDVGSQWQWVNNGEDGGLLDADIDADEAWDITTGGYTALNEAIVVCVVEPFGININHPDLAANMWKNPGEIPDNDLDDDGNGYIDDYHGWNASLDNDYIESGSHGTKVSGMIGARGNNGLGVTGINWEVQIMPVDMSPTASEANVLEAYTYPYLMRRRYNETGGVEGAFVTVINSSWGIDNGQPADAPIWCAFYDSLGAQGILSVAATSNSGVDVDQVGDLPTACPSDYLITVTATDHADIRYGGFGLASIDMGAPGVDVYTTTGSSGYGAYSGTSLAAPVVSGLVALMYSAPCSYLAGQAMLHPSATALYLRNALLAGVDAVPGLTTQVKTGGRVNAHNSLLQLTENCGPCPTAFHLEAMPVSGDTILLSWYGAPDAADFDLRYRLEGTTLWDTLFSVSNPVVLSGLDACQFYEYQVFSYCENAVSGFSESKTFQAPCACAFPENVDTVSVNTTQAVFSWDSVADASAYRVRYKALTDTEWTVVEVTGTEWTLDSLEHCKHYQFQVSALCGATEGEYHPVFTFKTDCAPSSAEEAEMPVPGLLVLPNPFADEARILVVLDGAAPLFLRVFDALGREVYARDLGWTPEGRHFFDIPAKLWPAGVYWVHVQMEEKFLLTPAIRQ
jgi:hypothetical protein